MNSSQGKLIWASTGRRFLIERTDGAHGCLVYRGEVIAGILHVPLLLAICRPYARVERLLSEQCNRPRLEHACLGIFVRKALRCRPEPQRFIVEAARPGWQDGHPLLEAIALSANPPPGTCWPAAMSKEVFGSSYFAEGRPGTPAEDLRLHRIERDWLEQGRIRLPGYFARFGVLTAVSHWRDRQAQANLERRRLRKGAPNVGQAEAISLLRKALDLIGPDLVHVLSRRKVSYRIIGSEAIAGKMQAGTKACSLQVLLSNRLFNCNFATALAVFVHEHAHVLGPDGSREFTDELTWMLEASVKRRHEWDELEQRWDNVRQRHRSVLDASS